MQLKVYLFKVTKLFAGLIEGLFTGLVFSITLLLYQDGYPRSMCVNFAIFPFTGFLFGFVVYYFLTEDVSLTERGLLGSFISQSLYEVAFLLLYTGLIVWSVANPVSPFPCLLKFFSGLLFFCFLILVGNRSWDIRERFF